MALQRGRDQRDYGEVNIVIELGLLAALLLFLGLAGWKIERDVDRKVQRIQKKCKAKEPRRKEREDYWAA